MDVTVGRIVHVTVNPLDNGGEDVAAAMVTKVHEKKEEQPQLVNLKVFLDQEQDRWYRYVPMLDERPDADEDGEEPEVDGARLVNGTQQYAFWPPRN